MEAWNHREVSAESLPWADPTALPGNPSAPTPSNRELGRLTVPGVRWLIVQGHRQGLHPTMCLKCRFYCCSGVVRPAGQETLAIETTVCAQKSSRGGAVPRGPHRRHREQGQQAQEPSLWSQGGTGQGAG